MDSVRAQLSERLGRSIDETDLVDLHASDVVRERFAARQKAVMLGAPTDGFSARVIAPRWSDVRALLPAAAALFERDEIVLLHDETSTVGGLRTSIEEVLAHAEALAAPADGPGIALASLDGRRGLELDWESGDEGFWTLLWWRETR